MLGTAAALVLVGMLVWGWAETLRARETAVRACRSVCEAHHVQLLDSTVALVHLGLRRTGGGDLRLRRVYEFEFSRSGTDRETGSITLLGKHVQAVYIPSP
jgi:hypothetical protein